MKKTSIVVVALLAFVASAWRFIPDTNNNVRVATTKGTGSGTINASCGTFITVQSSRTPGHIITLPDPVIGQQIVIHSDSDTFTLRSTIPDTISINGGKGVNFGSVIPGSTTLFATCVTATKWRVFGLDNDGDITFVPPASAVP